jgi:hypothetical protein
MYNFFVHMREELCIIKPVRGRGRVRGRWEGKRIAERGV